jgi:hypothetical protein
MGRDDLTVPSIWPSALEHYMPAVYIEFPKTEMTFYLFDDEVDEAMAKKLSKLGLVNLSVEFPQDPKDQYVKGDDGLYRGEGFANDSLPVLGPTGNSNYITKFDPTNNSIFASIEGRFFCFNTMDDNQPNVGRMVGFVWGIRLNNEKGKLIKKAKDQWGMSSPIEALAEKGVYGGGGHKVSFSISVENETFFG